MMITSSLPAHWVWVTLGDVCAIERGITFSSDAQADSASEKHIACLRTTNIQQQVNWKNLIYIPRTYVQAENKFVQQNDILISIANSRELVGKVSFVDEVKVEATFGGFISVIRASELVDAYYLYAFIKSDKTQERLRSVSNQTTNIANLTAKEIARLPIPLPPLPEQRRIAAILRQADALRQWRRDANEKTKVLKHSLFREVVGDYRTNQKQWQIVKVKDVGEVLLGRQRAPKYQSGQYTRPYLRVANVFEDRLNLSDVLTMDFDDRDFLRFKLEDNDILLNEGQSTELVGRPAMWHNEIPDCCFQNTLVRFRADKSKVEPEFALGLFLSYFESGEFAKISSKTSNMAHLGAGRFAEMDFVLPPLNVQRDYTNRLKVYRDVYASQLQSFEIIEGLFKSAATRAFTGELTAPWREGREDELKRAVEERDAVLRQRNQKPYQIQINTQGDPNLMPDWDGLRQVIGKFGEHLAKFALSDYQDNISRALQEYGNLAAGITRTVFTTTYIQSLRESLQAMQESIRLSTLPSMEPEVFWNYVDHLDIPHENRAIVAALDPVTLRVLKLAGTYSAYFAAEDLETGQVEGGISTPQAESSLRVLRALGIVRLVQIDGVQRYRLSQETDTITTA